MEMNEIGGTCGMYGWYRDLLGKPEG